MYIISNGMNLFLINIAYASTQPGESIDTFIHKVDTYIVNPLIMLMFAIALVVFLFGIFQFISNAENEEKKTEGKKHMIWGIIGLAIMLGVWTILGIILNTLGINNIVPEKGQVQLSEYSPSYPAVGTQ